MPIMTWDDSLDIGVEKMNGDHQAILDLMNKIFDTNAAGVKGAAVNLLVGQLGDVCKRHFADEEAYMRSIQYPGLDTHHQLHEKLLRRFGEFAAEIKARGGETDGGFFSFLKFWLSSHIKGIDVKYADHSRQGKAA